VTVLLSSHLLGEVQQICDTVTIINHGRVVTTGPVDEVLQSQSTGALAVGVADAPRALDVLVTAGFAARIQDGHILVDRVEDGAVVARALADAQLYPSWLMPQQVDLEQAFLAITADEEGVA
jgi:ABC-2 type transport system ATP-binding protein